jgi:hypothetical protein
MKNKQLFLFMCIIALFLQSCGAYSSRAPITSVVEETDKVVYKDFSSKINFGVVALKQSKLEGGQLKVQLRIENWTDDDIWCEVQTIFKDKSGFEIEKTNYAPILFKRRQVNDYQTNSISSDAEDFNIIIRAK